MSLILLCLAAFRDLQLFEDEIRLMSREMVLRKLEKILQEFSLHEAINQGIEEEQAKNLEIQLKTFGSYRLGCHHPDADIDVYINPCFFVEYALTTSLLCTGFVLHQDTVPASTFLRNCQSFWKFQALFLICTSSRMRTLLF